MHSIVSCVLILCGNGGSIMLNTYIVTINAFKAFHSSAWVTFLEVKMVLNNGVSSKGQDRDTWRWRVIFRCPQALMTGTLHSGTERWLHRLFREFYYPILRREEKLAINLLSIILNISTNIITSHSFYSLLRKSLVFQTL